MGKITPELRSKLRRAKHKEKIAVLVLFSTCDKNRSKYDEIQLVCEKAIAEISEALNEHPSVATFFPSLQVLYIVASSDFIRALASHRAVLRAYAAPKYYLKKREAPRMK